MGSILYRAAVSLCTVVSLFFGQAAFASEKIYGFGGVDPIIKESKRVDVVERISTAATYAMLFMAASVDSLFGGVAFPIALGAAGAYIGLADTLDHPSTTALGLDAEINQALPLNTYSDEHSVIVTEDTTESYKWKKELVKSAKHSIELSGSFCGGRAFQEILAIMREKLSENRELQIRILTLPELLRPEEMTSIQKLQEDYPNNFHLLLTPRIVIANPGFSTSENHVKVIIIDEQYFIMGGSNLQESMFSVGDGSPVPLEKNRTLSDKLTGIHARDMDMVGKGPAAKTLRLEFYKLWAKWAYLGKAENRLISYYIPRNSSDTWIEEFERCPKKVDRVSLKVIPSSPQWAENEIAKEYLKSLDKTIEEKGDIFIANMIFYPPLQILEKIIEAMEKGCKVTVISTNLQDNAPVTHHLIYGANRHGFVELLTAAKNAGQQDNLEIYEYNVADGIYHKKMFVMGEDLTMFSSSNLGLKSYFYDDELAIIIQSKEVASQVKAILEKDKSISIKLSHDQIDSFGSRLQGIFGTLASEVM